VEARGEKLGNLSDGALSMESKKKIVYLDSFDAMRGGYRVGVNVEIADIEKQIRDVELGLNGQMSLTKGGHRLTIRADPGKYLVTLANDEDYVIAEYWNKSARKGEKIDLAGDYWGSGMICTDVNQAVEIALKFCETGKLSRAAD
jgi:hypothetical protein